MRVLRLLRCMLCGLPQWRSVLTIRHESKGKGKVAFMYVVKAYGGIEVCIHLFLISKLRRRSSVPRNFVRSGRGSTNSVEDRGQRERRSGGGSPLVSGSEGSCNLVQEISFHIVNFLNFWYFRLFMTDNLFVIVNVKQLRTEGDLEFYCLFPNILGCWCPKFSNF
jgi:hypothetical protein